MSTSLFPFADPLQLSKGASLSYEAAYEKIWPLLTLERREKIERVVAARTFDVSVVLENIYDRGNASAVMRSAEALGLALVDSIEPGEKQKESQRTTAGADKWVELRRWKSTAEAVKKLKDEGRQIVVTYLSEDAKPIGEVDFSRPTAIVLGNEKDGVSKEMLEAADHKVILPMVGFVQSYNISVAAALCFYQIHVDRQRRLGSSGNLSLPQQLILKTEYARRTQPSADEILIEYIRRTSTLQ